MDNKSILPAVNNYGTPLYVFYSDEFENNIHELNNAYRSVYSNFQIAYSFKTNYMPAACKIAHDHNCFAEVVSDVEYQMAKKYGFDPKNIIVNGPGKWYGLREMLTDGAVVMLDNSYEAFETIKIASSLSKAVTVGIRLNFSIGSNKESRFGFDAEAEDTKKIIQLLRNSNNVSIVGLHFHLGGSRSIDAWKNRASNLIMYAEKLLEKKEMRLLDLGSGMFGHINPYLAKQFNQEIPSFDDYANVVATQFEKAFATYKEEDRPVLIVEPGSTLIANTMVYVTKVIGEKTIRGRSIVIVDGSVQQLGELGKKKSLPVHVLTQNHNSKVINNADITGYTCLEDDVLFHCYNHEIRVGDYLVFENAGAYTNVMKPPFIQACCGIVEVNKTGIKEIKRKETTDDILSTYFQGGINA